MKLQYLPNKDEQNGDERMRKCNVEVKITDKPQYATHADSGEMFPCHILGHSSQLGIIRHPRNQNHLRKSERYYQVIF